MFRRSSIRKALRSAAAGVLASLGLAGAASAGSFEGPFAWNFIPIHAALLPDGKIMTFGATPTDGQGGFDFDIWDPARGTGANAHLQLPNGTGPAFDSFCAGVILQAGNMRLMIAGGNANERVTEFGFKAPQSGLVGMPSMKYPRYYASLVTLPDGRVLVHGGSPSYGNQTNASEITEIYTPGQSWFELPGTGNSPMRRGDQATSGNPFWYPHVFPVGNNEVFVIAGKYTYRLNYSGGGAVTDVKPFNGTNYGATSSGLMVRPGIVMQIGGGSHGNNTGDGHPGSDVATVFDLRNRPETKRDTKMAFKRHWPTATVLANGEVLVVGGSEGNNELEGVANTTEIYNPDTDKWRTDATMTIPRLYHSTAILMKDGRVLVGGGGAPGPVVGRNAEIYTPDYLLDAAGKPAVRPSILTGPTKVAHGQSFPITTDKAIQRITIVKTGAVTHGYNTDQRFFEAAFRATGNRYTVTFPNDPVNATPGLYMVFAFDTAGVASVGKYVRLPSPIGDDRSDIPSDVPTSPAPTGTASVMADGEGWVRCATEGQLCRFDGVKTVRFGANGKYASRVMRDSAYCDVATLGNPGVGAPRACDVQSAASPTGDTTPAPNTPEPTPVPTPAPTPAPTAEAPAVGSTTPIVAVHSKLCLSVKDGSMSDGAELVQETCRPGAAIQDWSWRAANGGVMLVNAQSNKCADVFEFKTEDGAKLVQWGCWGGDNQIWKPVQTNAGLSLVSKLTNKCVDVARVSTADGAQVWQWQCLNSANQAWSTTLSAATPTPTPTAEAPAVGSTTPIVAVHSKLCLSVKDGSQSDGAELVQETCRPGAAIQSWSWRAADGGVMLVNAQSNKCVDVFDFKTEDGAKLVQWGCWGGDVQVWKPVQTNAGLSLVSKLTNKCLDVPGASTADGAQVWQWQCLNSANQAWSTALSAATLTPTAAPSPTWTDCAPEGQVCKFSGTKTVRYGANGAYATRQKVSGVPCDNATFGDPVPGIVKACQIAN